MTVDKRMSKNKIKLLCLEALLLIIAAIWLVPLYMVIINAFKTLPEILTNVLKPSANPSLDNFKYVLDKMDFPRMLLNTLVITVGVEVLVLFLTPMCAYKLSRVKCKLSSILLMLIVASMIVPFQSVMIPLVRVAKGFGFVNSIPGVIILLFVLYCRLPMFLYHGYISNIPLELEEAASLDGCNEYQTFFRVIFPQLKPITGTVAILTALWVWNDFALSNIMLIDPELKTLPTAVYSFFNGIWMRWDYALASLVMAALPIMIFFIVMQRNIIKGVMAGSVKG